MMHRRSTDRDKLKTIIGQAEMAASPAVNFAWDVAEAIGLDKSAVEIIKRIKKEDRIIEKANGRHGGKVEDVGDITGIRIIFSHTAQILALRYLLGKSKIPDTDFTRKWGKRGVKVENRTDNFWEPKPHGYIGYDIKIEIDLKKGRKSKCEIQMLHENMQQTDKITHSIYESKRFVEDRAKAEGRELDEKDIRMVESYNTSLRSLYEGDLYNREYGFYHLLQPGWQPGMSESSKSVRRHKGSHPKP